MNEQTEMFPRALPETTAIYPNRVADKQKVEAQKGWREHGDETTEFFTPRGTLFARGYVRIVYGDHGPYIEFQREHIRIGLEPKCRTPLPKHCFYEWLIPVDGSNIKVYDQKRDVRKLRNPPAGGFCGDRKEGYADYRVGFVYVSPHELNSAPR